MIWCAFMVFSFSQMTFLFLISVDVVSVFSLWSNVLTTQLCLCYSVLLFNSMPVYYAFLVVIDTSTIYVTWSHLTNGNVFVCQQNQQNKSSLQCHWLISSTNWSRDVNSGCVYTQLAHLAWAAICFVHWFLLTVTFIYSTVRPACVVLIHVLSVFWRLKD